MTSLAPALLKAYFDSRYTVCCDSGAVTFRIGGPLPDCLRRPFALVTAWNPRSVPLNRELNESRHAALRAQLDLEDWKYLPARGEGTNSWVEESLAILDIPLERALKLARQFGQNAIVWGDGQRSELVLCSGERPPRP
ncbi:DUF3293 domain-containing protein [Thermithiobacillus plumbiphilus]|uniref:DUF3293 domain-containing protein n=1 Tax=Thermithiobacillus plumbiphilus TaxID=1729899 RepID=A0ABU9D3X1_9PROT